MLSFFAAIALVLTLRRLWLQRAQADRRALLLQGAAALGLVLVAVAFAPTGYLLTKSIARMVLPMGLLWLFLLGAAFVALHRHGWRRSVPWWIGALLLMGIGNEFVAGHLTRAVEGDYAATRSLHSPEAPFDAVIVLGGGTDTAPSGEVGLGQAGDRVMLGARLFHMSQTPLLVCSGSPIAGLSSHDAMEATFVIWRQLDVPREAIVLVDDAHTTSEEARLHSQLARERGWTNVGLVSSALHLPRAMALFEAEGLSPIPLPADVRSRREVTWRGFYDVVPDAAAAGEMRHALWELLGRAAGR